MTSSSSVNLLDLDAEGLVAYCGSLGEKAFRAKQLQRWIHQYNAADFDGMTDLAKSLREKLKGRATITMPAVVSDHVSADGTRKWLVDVGNGNAVETVFIPEETRGTLCVSSQAGCAVNCRFCSTGKQGFSRNLTTGEIIGQLRMAEFALRAASGGAETGKGERVITNVVMMGMGEPLANFDNVLKAMRLMRDDLGFGLAAKRVTLSTAGMVPLIDQLSDAIDVSLAVSLHAANDDLRTELMPINKRYPIAELLAACQRWVARKPRTSITFEYTLMKGINDQPEHARQLIKLMRKLPTCKVNLIPFNPFPGTQFKRSDAADIHAFQTQLLNAGVLTMLRRTRGDDIDAACGQLAGQVTDRTRRSADIRKRQDEGTLHAI